jgi:hypothetical protein
MHSRATRVDISEPIAYLARGQVRVVRHGNVSTSGAFLVASAPDPIGTRGVLQLQHRGQEIALRVEVSRVSFWAGPFQNTVGMGVRFISLDAIERDFLDRFVAEGVSNIETVPPVHLSKKDFEASTRSSI